MLIKQFADFFNELSNKINPLTQNKNQQIVLIDSQQKFIQTTNSLIDVVKNCDWQKISPIKTFFIKKLNQFLLREGDHVGFIVLSMNFILSDLYNFSSADLKKFLRVLRLYQNDIQECLKKYLTENFNITKGYCFNAIKYPFHKNNTREAQQLLKIYDSFFQQNQNIPKFESVYIKRSYQDSPSFQISLLHERILCIEKIFFNCWHYGQTKDQQFYKKNIIAINFKGFEFVNTTHNISEDYFIGQSELMESIQLQLIKLQQKLNLNLIISSNHPSDQLLFIFKKIKLDFMVVDKQDLKNMINESGIKLYKTQQLGEINKLDEIFCQISDFTLENQQSVYYLRIQDKNHLSLCFEYHSIQNKQYLEALSKRINNYCKQYHCNQFQTIIIQNNKSPLYQNEAFINSISEKLAQQYISFVCESDFFYCQSILFYLIKIIQNKNLFPQNCSVSLSLIINSLEEIIENLKIVLGVDVII
ncbi:hypothetical protein TTHERM_001035729 (macronuclear) [Tetrahymena thermophila SB210]|uniref:Uncharacterized protein n=1 Tax=Tetrahymena thermophila (strain SB210) TaxID=312017 RepID=W7WZI6_TETTS|nr:hypothetical protein TTHERM_001035729 [Tetrahymena thermophila SB210]EWS71012.1 hypothetical protein TTHERM_001035729 [Tetrahymena thermophila SB210]|eukprot:XP_012656453.1 hypothetical protein TTHERM_001035729 [Tetrahymena thermophila SB210]